MPYRIAGIDVHKKMFAVVVADVEVDGEFDFERQKAGTTPTDLRRLADWLVEHEVEEVIERFSTLAHPRSGVDRQHFRPVRQSFARSRSRRTLCSRNSASRFRNRPDPTTEDAVWCGGRG